jgi:hypothetical protein
LFSAIALEFVFVPLFLKAMWPTRSKKSLALKIICSTLFVFAGLFAVKISGNTSLFSKFIFLGIYFLFGLLSFLAGHIFYICAYCWAIGRYFPGVRFFDIAETAAFFFVFGIAVLYAVLQKMKFGIALIPITAYTAILILMFTKASSLGLRMVFATMQDAKLICALLMLGALLFVISDSLLGIMMFNGKKNSHPMKIVNIITYFAAQILLACTILFLK